MGVGDHRVVPVLHTGRARVVGHAAERQPVAPVRPDRLADPDRGALLDEVTALLDVQLDELADPGEPLRVRAERRGIEPLRRHRLGHGQPVAAHEPACLVRVERPRHQPGARAGDPEAGALLVGEGDERHRAVRHHAGVAHRVEGGEGGDHAERAVIGAAVGHGVEVRAEHERGRRRVDARRDPPGPQVGVAVGLDVEPAGPRRGHEPLPAVELRGVERIPAIAPGGGVATDRRELRPERVERVHPASSILCVLCRRTVVEQVPPRCRGASPAGGTTTVTHCMTHGHV